MIENKIEEQKIRDILDAHTKGLMKVVYDYNTLANGVPVAELLEIYRHRNEALQDYVNREKRALAYLAGEKVESEVLRAEAILLPAGGLGG